MGDHFDAPLKKVRNKCLIVFLLGQINVFTFRKRVHNSSFWWIEFNLREKFKGQDFADLLQLVSGVFKYEQLVKDKDKGPHKNLVQNVASMENYEWEYECGKYDTRQALCLSIFKARQNKRKKNGQG